MVRKCLIYLNLFEPKIKWDDYFGAGLMCSLFLFWVCQSFCKEDFGLFKVRKCLKSLKFLLALSKMG